MAVSKIKSNTWVLIKANVHGTTSESIDLSGYSEILLTLAGTTDNVATASVYPLPFAKTMATINVVYTTSQGAYKYGRLTDSCTKALTGDSSTYMNIFAR